MFYLYSWEQVWFEFFILNCTRVVGVNDLEVWVDEFSLDRDSQFSNQISHLVDGQTLTSVQVKVVEYFPEESWVVLCQLENSWFYLSMQVLYSCLSYITVFMLWNLPGSFHHSNKVFITWSAHTEITIVITEFIPSNTSIIVSTGTIEVI